MAWMQFFKETSLLDKKLMEIKFTNNVNKTPQGAYQNWQSSTTYSVQESVKVNQELESTHITSEMGGLMNLLSKLCFAPLLEHW